MRPREQGSAAIAAIITAFIIVSLAIPFINWSQQRSREVTQQSNSSQAQWYADTGIELAQQRLKAPDLDIWLPAGSEFTLPSMAMRGGSCEVTLRRNLADASLVELTATGYFHIASGSARDSAGRAASRGRVRAITRVLNVAEFLAAKPRELKVDYGTNVSNGKVYGETITFIPRGTNPSATPTQVEEALYVQNCTGANPPDVILNVPCRQLAHALDLGAADAAMRSLYFQRTQGAGSVPEQTLDVAQPFYGLRSAPSGGAPNVYFAAGDLHIGTANEPLRVSGVYTIYATGSVLIHNSIVFENAQSWIAIVTEKDFVILDAAAPDFVPANLSLNGNFYANGGWLVRGMVRPAGSALQLNGGFVVHGRIEFGTTWPTDRGCTRTYTFARSPDPHLLLPNLTTLLDYHVER